LNKNKILLIDDDVGITLTFKTALEEKGYVIDAYNDPILALSNFRANVYDLILIDIRMPKMNGFELYLEILNIDNKARVIFITAFRTYYESLGENMPKATRPSFIKKPIEINELIRRITMELET
jgi:two-component system, OmpR family, response regulator ChvI